MMRTWQRRSHQQAELIGALPDIPDQVGAATITTRGHYGGSMMAPGWSERRAAGDLGFRRKGLLTRYADHAAWDRSRPDGPAPGDPESARRFLRRRELVESTICMTTKLVEAD